MALNDKSACVRATAIESTAQRCKKNQIYSPKIVEQSQITAFDKSTNVRRATAFAISVINDKATIPLLINLLKDPNGDVRNWAAFAINMIIVILGIVLWRCFRIKMRKSVLKQ